MAHVGQRVRENLGLNFNPDAISVREAMLRSAAISPPAFNLPPRVEDWFVTLANLAGDLAPEPKPAAMQEVVEEAMRTLHAWMAPVVLAMISPHQQAPRCEATALPGECQAAVRRQLPTFLGRVLAQWRDGALRHEWRDTEGGS